MTKLICVPVDEVDVIYPQIEPMLKAAYEKTDHFYPDVSGWLKRDAGKLWLVIENDERVLAALTTSMESRPSGAILRLVANAGIHADVWKHHLGEIEEWYRGQGAKKVVFDGRRGWERSIPGYHVSSVTMEKVL